MNILHKLGLALALSALAPHCASATFTPVLESTVHLGGATPEWSIFERQRPQGKDLRIEFNSTPNQREYTLFIRQDDVKQDWSVTLNGLAGRVVEPAPRRITYFGAELGYRMPPR